jgi:hypothetical protein
MQAHFSLGMASFTRVKDGKRGKRTAEIDLTTMIERQETHIA